MVEGVLFYHGECEGSARVRLIERDGAWVVEHWESIAASVEDDDEEVIADESPRPPLP